VIGIDVSHVVPTAQSASVVHVPCCFSQTDMLQRAAGPQSASVPHAPPVLDAEARSTSRPWPLLPFPPPWSGSPEVPPTVPIVVVPPVVTPPAPANAEAPDDEVGGGAVPVEVGTCPRHSRSRRCRAVSHSSVRKRTDCPETRYGDSGSHASRRHGTIASSLFVRQSLRGRARETLGPRDVPNLEHLVEGRRGRARTLEVLAALRQLARPERHQLVVADELLRASWVLISCPVAGSYSCRTRSVWSPSGLRLAPCNASGVRKATIEPHVAMCRLRAGVRPRRRARLVHLHDVPRSFAIAAMYVSLGSAAIATAARRRPRFCTARSRPVATTSSSASLSPFRSTPPLSGMPAGQSSRDGVAPADSGRRNATRPLAIAT
jgi:hypothetical protein